MALVKFLGDLGGSGTLPISKPANGNVTTLPKKTTTAHPTATKVVPLTTARSKVIAVSTPNTSVLPATQTGSTATTPSSAGGVSVTLGTQTLTASDEALIALAVIAVAVFLIWRK